MARELPWHAEGFDGHNEFTASRRIALCIASSWRELRGNDGVQQLINIAVRALPHRLRGLRLGLRVRLDHQQRRRARQVDAPAVDVDLLASAGFVREWNFRAPSGFTAVGLRRYNTAHSINGVLFRVPAAEALDSREARYERLPIRPPDLRILSPAADDDATRHAAAALAGGRARFWVTCRSRARARARTPDLPDVRRRLLVGCLERGGAELARRWVQTTGGWSEFWLNDAPLSRRPWLHRPRHAEIDAILQAEQARTRFDERRHPEDFEALERRVHQHAVGRPAAQPALYGAARDARADRERAERPGRARLGGGAARRHHPRARRHGWRRQDATRRRVLPPPLRRRQARSRVARRHLATLL